MSVTPRGTVLIILSNRALHVFKKKSFDFAKSFIKAPLSALKIRRSELVVSGPMTKGSWEELETNWVALNGDDEQREQRGGGGLTLGCQIRQMRSQSGLFGLECQDSVA